MIDINALIELADFAKENDKEEWATAAYSAAIALAEENGFNDLEALQLIFDEEVPFPELGKKLNNLLASTNGEIRYSEIPRLGELTGDPEWAKNLLLSHSCTSSWLDDHIKFAYALAAVGAVNEAKWQLMYTLVMFHEPNFKEDVITAVRDETGSETWVNEVLKQYEEMD